MEQQYENLVIDAMVTATVCALRSREDVDLAFAMHVLAKNMFTAVVAATEDVVADERLNELADRANEIAIGKIFDQV